MSWLHGIDVSPRRSFKYKLFDDTHKSRVRSFQNMHERFLSEASAMMGHCIFAVQLAPSNLAKQLAACINDDVGGQQRL